MGRDPEKGFRSSQRKYQMLWVIPKELIHAPDCKNKLDQISEKTMQIHKIEWKPEWEKTLERKRESTITMAITIVYSGMLGFLGSESSPCWKGFSIYTSCICFDKAAEFSSICILNHLSKKQLELNIQI